MWMQTSNRTDTERVWLNFTNSDGQTISVYYPVAKFTGTGNTASISTNEAASRAAIWGGAIKIDAVGSLIGLAYEDVADNDVGVAQVYGYLESALCMQVLGSVTVNPGHPLGIVGTTANSIGLSSAGITTGFYGPVVALDTITSTMHSLGVIGAKYANHVFLRCL